jgi:hypothetical protein
MGSDRARVSYDGQRQYRSVIMQQGRVTVEADWNEAGQIVNEEIRKEALDVVGPCGTHDNGYGVNQITELPLFPIDDSTYSYDFPISKGTMYVGGMRVVLDDSDLHSTTIKYSQQQKQEWLDGLDHLNDPPPFPVWVDLSTLLEIPPKREFIYLYLREQEVSAVEDTALREVALGGPDTAQRTRLVQRIVRHVTNGKDCKTALAEAVQQWAAKGLNFEDQSHSMRLMPTGTLQASFTDMKTDPKPCEPQAHGGYLGADNQLIRIQISGFDSGTGKWKLVWGFDNASFLYRVEVAGDLKTLKLQSRPVDDFHKPKKDQAVEILSAAVHLNASDSKDYVASATGIVRILESDYASDIQSITLRKPLPDINKVPVLFLRVWEKEESFTPGTAVPLGSTGLQVTLQTTDHEPLHVGSYWQIAVRPSTQTEVYPRRYLDGPQPPDGPRLWVCPLAVIEWETGTKFKVLEDCRNRFENLVELTKRNLGGCCTKTVRPGDDLKTIIDTLKNSEQATVCLMPGIYSLPEPLQLDLEHSNLTLECCHDGVFIQAASGSDPKFVSGLINLNKTENVTIRGLHFVLPSTSSSEASASIPFEISIGILSNNCTNLIIKDCHFQFSPKLNTSTWGAGIFMVGYCQGLTIEGNRFVRNETAPLQEREQPFTLLYGYLQSSSISGGSGILSLLDDASFQDNRFSGLSAATLIEADIGSITIERNKVRNCYAGFWLLSPGALYYFVLGMLEIEVNRAQIDQARELYNVLQSVVRDPIIQIGSVIARGYPLPKTFDVSNAVQVRKQRARASKKTELTPMQILFNRALGALSGGAHTTGKDRVKLGEVVTAPDKTIFSSGLMGTMNPLHERLSNAEGAILLAKADIQVLPLSLHISNNDIEALFSDISIPTACAILVMYLELEVKCSVIMSANKLRNNSPIASILPTALIEMLGYGAITGNLILNEGRGTTADPTQSSGYSLSTNLVGGAAAITGNAFRGELYPPQLKNQWESQNAMFED